MKRAKRLTRFEKILISKQGFNPNCFLKLKKGAEYYEFLEITSGKILTLRR